VILIILFQAIKNQKSLRFICD